MGLAEGVAAGHEGDRLLVVHGHAAEGLADVAGGASRVWLAIRAFGVDVDEAHLDRGERVLEVALVGVALVAEPGALTAPVDVVLGLPDVLAAAGEAERLEPHRFQGDVASEHEQVGPGELAAVLLLDREQQPPSLVEVRVVGPAIEWGEALRAGAGAAAAVAGAVGAGAVPGHADEERAVMAIVRRPPGLRRRHQRVQVLHDRVQVEGLELLRVVERLAERVGLARVLVEDVQVELVGPPVAVHPGQARRVADDRALALAWYVRVHVRHPFLGASYVEYERSVHSHPMNKLGQFHRGVR